MKKKIFAALILLAFAAPLTFAAPCFYIKGALGYGYRVRDWHRTYSYDMGSSGSSAVLLSSDSASISSDSSSTSGSTKYKFDTTVHAFVVTPTFGIAPWWESDRPFLRGLSFEISVEAGVGPLSIEYAGLNFEIDALAFVLNPKIMAVYSYKAGKVVPYSGVGFSVPIIIIPEFGNYPHTYSSEAYGVSFGYEAAVVKAAFNVNLMAGLGFAVSKRVMPFVEVDFGFGFGFGTSVDARAGIACRLGRSKQ